MRKSLLFLLLASSAVPAFAADERGDRNSRRDAARAERAEARAERQAERAQESRSQEAPPEARPVQRNSGGGAPVVREQRREAIQQRVIDRGPERGFGGGSARPPQESRAVERSAERSPGPRSVRPALEQRQEAVDSVGEWRRAERQHRRTGRPAVIEQQTASGWESLRERRREAAGRDGIGNRRAPMVSRIPREGTQPPARAAARRSSLSAQHWRGDWRSDRRFDWRKHRNRHRSLFHLGFYFDPFGWSYRPYSISWRMWPSYYRSTYWLNDPWRYRLPYAPPGYRWIRYYDDAILVDTWDGRVVDVIHNFFW